MERRRNTQSNPETPVTDFRYSTEHRKDIPPAGVGIQGRIQEEARIRYDYDPHRPPVLRFNEEISRHKALLEKATKTSLTHEEAAELAALLESPQPWLEWAGKRENSAFEVDPVALHIHERVSAQAILKAVRREDAQRDLFGDNSPAEATARSYYQHDVDWANRLILGDSLQVMTSLTRREGLAGKVQMIYIDPPYGIKFSSNWQNEVGKREVKEKDEDLSREPEMIKAYRDTWTLGVHSYLAYLKQRLIVARELLTDSGSVFVQISDENLHRVRAILDEVFGSDNFIAVITVQKTSAPTDQHLPVVSDYIIWYAKNLSETK
jgi:adenine-specific DNA-methyltransferase